MQSALEEIDGKVTKTNNLAQTLGYNPFETVRKMHARGGGVLQFY